MGRPRRHRQRLEYELRSVRAKSIQAHLAHVLRAEYGQSKSAATILSTRSLEWLSCLEVPQLPGQVWLSVPETASKALAHSRRRLVLVTAVDVPNDCTVWQNFGLAVLQRHRLVRWILEIHRQGGVASLSELAAWASLTPNALLNRLRPLRELKLFLPHVGGPARCKGALPFDAFVLECSLKAKTPDQILALLGMTTQRWEALQYRFIRVVTQSRAGVSEADLANEMGLLPEDIGALKTLSERHKKHPLLREWLTLSPRPTPEDAARGRIEDELINQYSFQRVTAAAYANDIRSLALRLRKNRASEGVLTYFAMEARRVPVLVTRRRPRSQCYSRFSPQKTS